MLKPVTGVMYGCDPELFVERDGHIIGSEKVIPFGGLKGRATKPGVVQDGVQVELNPPAKHTPALLGWEIAECFHMLDRQLQKHEGVRVCWKRFVEVRREELDSLSEKNRELGCKPSKNVYGDRPLLIDGKTYLKRGTGGHLHFGLKGELFAKRKELVPWLDIFVGNTCVLLDRAEGMAERRENYGRAGEYRDPDHGLEYRTLSSFWLRNYTLMSLVFGLANIALAGVLQGGKAEEELINTVDIDHVIEAIDTNNYDLARANFERIRPWLMRHLPKRGFQLAPENIIKFVVLTSWIKQDGLEEFFKQDPMQHWREAQQIEFEEWISHNIK